jgi:hypothetical protein
VITFLDGPAKGVELALRRVPKYLRVVRSCRGKWDALDQLDDEPRPREQIFVYVRRDDLPQSKMFVRASKRSLSGVWFTCSYTFLQEQPEDFNVRTTWMWQQWASRQNSTRPLFDFNLEGITGRDLE